jgi:hypothetical protein
MMLGSSGTSPWVATTVQEHCTSSCSGKQWQILALQIIATVALVGMYLEVVSTYVVGSIDHTMLFDTIEVLIGPTTTDW